MLPYSLPSSTSAFGRRQMRAYPYTPQAGDVAWVDYIPVRFVPDNFQEGTYNQKGFVAIDIISSPTGRQAWVDYVPIVIDDTRTDAWLVNRVGYIPVNFSGTGDGTASNKGLSLNFLGAETLDPRITFSRASNATVTNSSGLIQFAPHNLFTHSEQFDNSAVWIPITATVSANSSIAPNGTTTADKLIVTSGQAAGYVTQATSLTTGVTYTYTIYAKAAGVTSFRILGPSAAFGSGVTNQTGAYDLTTGVASVVTGTPTVSMENVGNGWYRCVLTTTATATTTSGVQYRIATTGNGVDGVFIWGAQLNVGSLQPYYPTTVKNLLGFSEAFDNAAWGKANCTVTANPTATSAPNGTFTADKIVSAASTSTQQLAEFSFSTINANPYTFSTYVKAAEYTFARIRSFEGSPFARAVFIDVNLTTGAIVRTDATGGAVLTSSSVTNVGNGWYRASMTFTLGGTGTAIAGQIVLNDGTNNFNITGNGTSGIYVWGAQLSDSASLDQYVNNPVAAPTAAAYYGPRFDYDPVTLQPRGLLIEEQRTNLFQRSEEFDTAYWVKENTTVTANAAISPDGTQDAESIVSAASGYTNFRRAGTTVTANTAHTASIYVKASTGATSFSITLVNNTFTSGVISVFNLSTGAVTSTTVIGTATGTSSTITNVGNGWYRVTSTAIVDTTSTSIRVDYVLNNFSSTIFAWGAQLEAGAFATSYIPTTSAQVTRSADVALIQGSNFSGWFNQTEGTIYGSGSTTATAGAVKCAFHIAKTNNAIGYQYVINANGTSSGFNIYNDANAYQGTPPYPAVSGAQLVKFAGAYKTNDSNAVITVNTTQNTAATSTSITLPTALVQMNIGAAQTTQTSFWNGHIRSIAYYPTRLQNSQLQAVTQ